MRILLRSAPVNVKGGFSTLLRLKQILIGPRRLSLDSPEAAAASLTLVRIAGMG